MELNKYTEGLWSAELQEGMSVEFKSAKSGFPRSIWETYSAFANTDGGKIILGVNEGDLSTIAGLSITQAKRYEKEFWNIINNKEFVSKNILSNDDFNIIEAYRDNDSKYIIIIQVPRANIEDRPIYIKGNPFGNTYKRCNEGDYKCTVEEVKRLIADSSIGTSSHDSRILTGYAIDDIDISTLNLYRTLFATKSHKHPWSELDDIQFLTQLGAYRKDRITKKEGFTLAGILMFGKTSSIQDPVCAPTYMVDYQECLSNDPDIRWTDRIYLDGTWEGNLLQFYKKVSIKLNHALSKPFKLEKQTRIDFNSSHISLREAFVNTLIHADYSAPGSIIIKQGKEILTFSNPGSLLISIKEYYQGGNSSVCRNRNLQKMFTLIGLAETAGSGASKIIKGWKDIGLKLPTIATFNHPDKVILTMPLTSILPRDIETFLLSVYGDIIKDLSDERLLILSACFSHESRTHKDFKDIINRHSADISKILKQLCKESFIISVGQGPATRYSLNEKYADSIAALDRKKKSIGQKTSYSKLVAIITSIAADFISLSEISVKTGKSNSYLRGSIIPKMIKEGRLERLYPDLPRHSNQKYKAANKQTS